MKNLAITGLRAWQLAALLALGAGPGPALAQTPVLSALTPDPSSTNVGRYAPIEAQFATPGISPASRAGLKVFSRQRGGQRAGTAGSVSAGTNNLIYNPGSLGPTVNFKAGEVVQVSVTPAVTSPGGVALAPPAVFEFTTETDGSGRGVFRPGSDVAAGPGPGQVVAADVDGDGDLDLVAADQSSSSLNVRLNGGNAAGGGTGTFSNGPNLPVAGGVFGVAVGDVDGDGDLDLVTADGSSSSNLSVLRNNGSGQFSLGSTGILYNNPTRLVLGDIDGDGDLDLVTNSGQGGLVSIRLNDGTGAFPGTNYPGGLALGSAIVADVALTDVDHDHDLDLVLALSYSGGSGELRVLLNGGDGNSTNTGAFSNGTTTMLQLRPVALAVNDLNGDNRPDVALTGANTSNGAPRLAVQFNDGAGGFGSGVAMPCPANPQAVAVGDVNADLNLDLVVACGDPTAGSAGTLFTVFNRGAQGFDPATARSTALGNGTLSLALADVDNDGDLDALTGNLSAGTVSVRLNGPGPEINVVQSGTTYLSGSTYGFGNLTVGNFVGQTFTIQNLSPTDTLHVSAVGPTSQGLPANTGLVGGFGVTNVPFRIAPGGTSTLSVTASPPALGLQTSQFTIVSDDVDEPTYVLNLSANGVAPSALPDLTVTNSVTLSGAGGSYVGPYNNVTVTSTGALYNYDELEVHGALVVQTGGFLQNVAQTGGPCPLVTGPGSFTLEDGATMVVCPAAGLSTTGAVGAVQVSGTRTFSPGASYLYYNTNAVAQVTGPGLPAQVRRLEVGTGELTLSQPVAVKEVLRLSSFADLLTAGHALTLLSDASGTALLVNSNSGRVVGDATVERYNSSTYRGPGYRHYSSPVSNATIASLTTPGFTPVVNPLYNSQGNTVRPFPTVFGFAQNPVFENGWASPQALTDPMSVGHGYTVQIPATETVRFTGPLNQSPHGFALANNSDPAGAWYFLGNPFPSPINWGSLTTGTGPTDNLSNVGAAVYVFEASGPYAGSYRTAVAGVGGSPVIASGQGFFVRTGGFGLGSYIFGLFNRNRVTTFNANNNTFHRAAPETRPLLTLALRDAAGRTDPASIYFTPAATPGFDLAHDAAKLPNPGGMLNLSSRLGSEDYAINGLPLLGRAPLVLPLTVAVPSAGAYELAVDQMVNFAPGTTLYLRDALLNRLTPLAAATRYAFALAGTSAPGRFSVEFRPAGALASAAQVLEAQVQVFPNPAGANVPVMVTAPAGAAVTLLNALGQVVRPAAVAGPAGSVEVAPAGLAAGLYVLRVRTSAGEVSRRLVVQ